MWRLVYEPAPLGPAVLFVAGDVLGLEPDHFEQVAQGVETAPARHAGEIGRQGRHVIGYHCAIAGFAGSGLVAHAVSMCRVRRSHGARLPK